MVSGLYLLGLPALVVVVLSLLPPGRVAVAGLWLGVALAIGSLVLFGGGEGDALGYGAGFYYLVLTPFALALMLATIVQLSRHLRREAPMLPLFAILIVVAGLTFYLLRKL